MQDVVILSAVRTPIGRRKGGLAGLHPADLLGVAQRAAVERAGIDPAAVGQIIGGCVSQVGEQSFDIARTAWLAQGLPLEVAATTIDSQCGSSQQATTLAAGMIGAGIEDVVLACGVEIAVSPAQAVSIATLDPDPSTIGIVSDCNIILQPNENYEPKSPRWRGAIQLPESFKLLPVHSRADAEKAKGPRGRTFQTESNDRCGLTKAEPMD